MDQTEWPVDAASHEQNAEEFLHQGRMDAAASCYEQALRMRLECGDAPAQLVEGAEALARASNHACKDAVPKAAERQLHRTLGLLHDVRDVAGASGAGASTLLSCINLTFANLAALLMRSGRHSMALKYLKEAEALGAPPAEAAATQLSLCALLSQLGRHKEAEHHASEAVAFGEADILDLSCREAVTAAMLREKASALAVAYNNLAVQREYLGENGLHLYEKAVVLAEGHMEKDNPLLARLRESHRNALQISVTKSSSSRRPSSAVNLRTAPRREAQVKRPLSAMEARRGNGCSGARNRKASLDQELLHLLRPEEQDLLAARNKARELEGESPVEVPLTAPVLPRHMRVALEQQREGARFHQTVTRQEAKEDGQCFVQDAGSSESSSRRRESGDLRLQHALHFAGCEAARRIQQAYRRHRWLLKVMREARQARELQRQVVHEARELQHQAALETPHVQHETVPDAQRQDRTTWAPWASSSASTNKPSEKISHSSPSDALPRPRAIELSGLPRRNLPSLGSAPGSLGSLGSLGTLGPSKERGAPRTDIVQPVQPVQPIQAVQAVPQLKEEVEPFQFQPIPSIQPVRQADKERHEQQLQGNCVSWRTREREGVQQVSQDAEKAERELEARLHEKRQYAAATIQASWSRFRQLKRQRMAVWLQTMVRCRLQQQELLLQCSATKLIQRKWIVYKTHKATLAEKAQKQLEERQLEEKEKAATTIQSSWSQFRRLKRQRMAVWLQTMVRCRLQQQEFLHQCRATRLIQRSWISYKTHKDSLTQEGEKAQQDQAEVSDDAKEAEREPEERQLKEREHAAAKIQSSWSQFRRLKRQRMAVWLQTMVRCRLQQQEFLHQCRATRLIQRSWISYKTHKDSLTREGEKAQQDQAEVSEDAKKAEREPEERQLEEREHAAATIQAFWSRFRRLKRQRMAVWLQTMVRCRLQQQEFLHQSHASRLSQKGVSLVAGIAQDVDCFSNGSRDTTASEEETKVFKPKCDAWACARCGLVNEVSPDICVLCEGPKPLRRSSLAHRAKQRRAR